MARRNAFNTRQFPAGLNLKKMHGPREESGNWQAASSASFRAGAPVMLNSDGEVVIFNAANGSSLLGVAKWDKVSLGRSVVIDEEVLFGEDLATVDLAHANLVSASVAVRSAVEGGGTEYTVTTDYTINATNGTITHVGTIDSSLPVYVSYTYELTESDYRFQGKNFFNSNDFVTNQDRRIVVIQPPCEIFTTEFDTAEVYTLTGATSNVYANSSGLFTSSSSSAKLCGKVIQVPTATDPYLGFRFIGQVAANS